jgi:hypothetical protein
MEGCPITIEYYTLAIILVSWCVISAVTLLAGMTELKLAGLMRAKFGGG